MSKQKKPRPKYNVNKQLARVGNHLVKHILLVKVPRNSGYVLYHTKKRVCIQPDNVVMGALSHAYYWSVLVAGLGYDAVRDERYIKTDGFVAKTKYLARNLNPLAEEYMIALLKTMNDNQLVGEAWIASPAGVHVTEEDAMEIFKGMQAWDVPIVEPELIELLRRSA